MQFDEQPITNIDPKLQHEAGTPFEELTIPRANFLKRCQTLVQEVLLSSATLPVVCFSGGQFLSCNPPSPSTLIITEESRANLNTSAGMTLEMLEHVHNQLVSIDEIRKSYSILIGPFLALNPKYTDRYEDALKHHEELLEEVEDKIQELIDVEWSMPNSFHVCVDIYIWAQNISHSLDSIFELLNGLRQNGKNPKDWKAPQGFEYLTILEK